jgi:hypothetical protein
MNYPETRRAIDAYRLLKGSRSSGFEEVGRASARVQEAFIRESPAPPPDVENMSPSYIEWLINGGRPIQRT